MLRVFQVHFVFVFQSLSFIESDNKSNPQSDEGCPCRLPRRFLHCNHTRLDLHITRTFTIDFGIMSCLLKSTVVHTLVSSVD